VILVSNRGVNGATDCNRDVKICNRTTGRQKPCCEWISKNISDFNGCHKCDSYNGFWDQIAYTRGAHMRVMRNVHMRSVYVAYMYPVRT
jgi:hypothetical protein